MSVLMKVSPNPGQSPVRCMRNFVSVFCMSASGLCVLERGRPTLPAVPGATSEVDRDVGETDP